ncbi:Sugar phosphate transporter [Gracilaria domingensis]|nr:Sugar phosphate transporter [Gracilaria domingensis]
MAAVGAGHKSDKPASEADAALEKKYLQWRIRIFYSIFTGYASFYLTRNSFTYVAPVMRQALGFSLEQLGIIMSVFPLAYGFSKLVAGILSDRFSTRLFMSIGLAVTGVINILFGFQTSLYAFIALWLANGLFQAAGAPPCAKLLTTWYSRSERGTWWGFWNTSHNTGGFLIPLLAGYCARAFGWQYGMIVPGVISIFMGMFLFNRLRDNPEAVGLPPVDEVDNKNNQSKGGKQNNPGEDLSPRQKLFKYVLSNPYVWLLAVSYFFVYFVRQGVSSWAHIFLLDYKGVGDAQEAAFRVSGMEIGGLLGSLVSGWASDKMMRGRRIPIIVLWLIGVMASVACLWFIPATWRYASWLAVFCIGFFIYGPQMLVGLAGAEIVDKSAVSSTIGLLGWIAYLGAAVSGYPLTKIVSKLGWGAYFASLIGFAGTAMILLLPMWRLGMGAKKKPMPEVPEVQPVAPGVPAVAAAGAPAGGLVAVPSAVKFVACNTCAGTGSVMKLECGPATPSQTLSCKYLETPCPWCGGSGYLQESS